MQFSSPTADVHKASIAVFDQGRVGIESVDLPTRRRGEIDVAISSAAICGSDLHTVLGHRPSPPRSALGHEAVGYILDADETTTDMRGTPLRTGDRVVFALFNACGSCDRCNDGLTMKCRSLVKYGHESVSVPPHATGMLADRVRLLPGVAVLKVPREIDDAFVVSSGCAVATAAAVVAAAGPVTSTTRVLVFGAGAVGAYCIAMLASLGCSVHVRDPSKERLALAEKLGGVPAESSDNCYDVIVEASGSPEAVQDAIQAADVGARVVAAGSVSPGHTTVTFDPADVVTRRLSILGVHNYRESDFLWGFDWLLQEGQRLPLDQLVSPPLPLHEIEEGFMQMRAGQYPRILVQPPRPGRT